MPPASTAGPSKSRSSFSTGPFRQALSGDLWGLGLSSDLLPAEEPPKPSNLLSSPSQVPAPKPIRPSTSRKSSGQSSDRLPIPSDSTFVRRRSRGSSSQLDSHPLSRTSSSSPQPGSSPQYDLLGDVTRPTLKRLTSDIERRAGSSRGDVSDYGSRKSSMEVPRTVQTPVEVEVLIHQVKPNESLVGIALLYGIDLAVLRKTNKMWPSDPVHLRTHLYIPIEACHWNKASEVLVRGPGEGQATLVPKGLHLDGPIINGASGKGKGKEKIDNLVDITDDEPFFSPNQSRPPPSQGPSDPYNTIDYDSYDPWSDMAASPTQTIRPLPSPDPDPNDLTPTPITNAPDPRVLTIVRLPASQLRFFPRATPSQPASSRTSFDSELRRAVTVTQTESSSTPTSPNIPTGNGTSIQNDLKFNHNPGDAPKPKFKSNTVRLRPPTSYAPAKGGGITEKLTNLFIVAPPPPSGLNAPPVRHPTLKSKISLDLASSVRSSPRGSKAGSLAGSVSGSPPKGDELEMIFRSSRMGSQETLRANGDALAGKGKQD